MKLMLGVLVAVFLPACSAGGGQSNVRAGGESHNAARAGDPKCDNKPPAFIEAGEVGPARLLGSTKVRARTVNDPRFFATDCDVPLTLHHADDCKCTMDASIHFNGAWMSIDEKGSGKFEMHIEWPHNPAENFTVEMQAGRDGSAVSSGPTDYLVGTRDIYTNDEKKYFVLFDNTLGETNAGQLPLWKTYWIQVYVKPPNTGAYLCSDHMPDHSSEDGYKFDAKVQAGTGGGIEPGRRP